MKIYTLVELTRIEDSEGLSIEHFSTKEEAQKALLEKARKDIDTLDDGWESDDIEDGMEFYSSWEDGYECHNHYSLSIFEKEFPTKRH